MSLAWVIGSGGLLGSSLCQHLRQLGTPLFEPKERLRWQDSVSLASQFTASVEEFSVQVPVGGSWEIYWCAGVGTMHSTEEQLQPETEALVGLLHDLDRAIGLKSLHGTFCLASSAGAIYAESDDKVITEATETHPTTPYARSKLRQELLVTEFVSRAGGQTTALLARLSTIYGCGQARDKPQGLITHIARQVARRGIVHVFVPLDTIRDYIFAEDAAARLVAGTRALIQGSGAVVRIVASERPATIAQIVSAFQRLSGRRPAIVTAASPRAAVYMRCVQFRSLLSWQGVAPPVPLPLGIARVLAEERRRLYRGC